MHQTSLSKLLAILVFKLLWSELSEAVMNQHDLTPMRFALCSEIIFKINQ
jgi:hypothetical protein